MECVIVSNVLAFISKNMLEEAYFLKNGATSSNLYGNLADYSH